MKPRDHLDQPDDTVMNGTTERRPRRGGGWLLALGALALLTTGLAFGVQGYYSRNRELAAVAEQARNFIPQVRVAAVRPSDDIVQVSLPATTTAYDVADIFARASGYIETREVDIGDKVKKGQLLAKIAVPELDDEILQAQATLGQLKAALQQAQANLDLAKVTWQRDKPLVDQGWITKQQGTIDVQSLKAQEAAVGVAQANVNAQQDQLRVLDQQQAYQQVVAPFDGVITQRNVDIGSLVQADTTNSTFLFAIMQGDVIRAQVFVPQDQAFGLTPGVKAVLQVPEIPGRTFPGTVTRIADALAPGTRTLLTEIDIPNPDGVLTPGTYCTVELQIPRKTPSFSVSADAIIFNADGLQVAVVEDGIAHIRKISVARDLGKEVEVRDGVKKGDLVILNPPVELAEGSKVQISPAAVGTP
ncbi:efflux transporter periplasmic adaptor subunit [Mesorhizobium sanjuanii]|uniref:Efflux transporter periplasmic adaptor subunit n=1 Tax=Mesorhizobium sanjuanii TaxID=2037900 RepID=A0A2A6FA72_9HYPH|nr:efflux RND transporter periplasmic adaptor subunit [Mesorhizobium sanjuanii]PDQ18662.1 efflux transporter periplasmic adaptor subunit [Mesorhizobium sanjuanii]